MRLDFRFMDFRFSIVIKYQLLDTKDSRLTTID